jgi:hypothetical protein
MRISRAAGLIFLVACAFTASVACPKLYSRWSFWKDADYIEYKVLANYDRPAAIGADPRSQKAALVEISKNGTIVETREIPIADLRLYPVGGRLSWYYNSRVSEWSQRAEFSSYWGEACSWATAALTLCAFGTVTLVRSRRAPSEAEQANASS